MTEPMSFHLQNVGGIREFTARFDGFGVYALLGRNGAGKSTTMNAIVRAQGGKAPVEVSDGAHRGSVVGPGVRLSLGKVCRQTGVPEIALADPSPVGDLIDPQLKSSDAAAKARLKALLQLVDLPVDAKTMAALADGDEGLSGFLDEGLKSGSITNLIEASEALRKEAQSQAREAEKIRDEKSARRTFYEGRREETISRLPEDIGVEDIPKVGTADALAEQLDEAIRSAERARIEADARERLEEQQADIRKSLGDRPDTSDLEVVCGSLSTQIGELKAQLEELEKDYIRRRADLANLKERQEAWDRQSAVLDQEVTGATREESDALEESIEDLRNDLSVAHVADEYAGFSEEIESSLASEQEHQQRADALRSVASTVTDRLGELLEAAGLEGLTVVDGRLHAAEGDRLLDFETRLSEGQRTRVALELATRAFPERIVPIDSRYWATLDPEAKKTVAEQAEELRIYVLVEEPTSGDLRMERYAEAEEDAA